MRLPLWVYRWSSPVTLRFARLALFAAAAIASAALGTPLAMAGDEDSSGP